MKRNAWGMLLVGVVLLLLSVRRFSPAAVFLYAHVTRPLTRLIAGVSARFSFPLADCFMAFAIIVLFAVFMLPVKHHRKYCAMLSCLLLTVYMLLWGIRYALPGSSPEKPSVSSLTILCNRLLNGVEEALPCFSEQEGEVLLETGCQLMCAHIGAPLSSAKWMSFPQVFSALGIAGMYFPFTGESLVNPTDLPDTLPFTICHEMAHQAGFAREDEASFAAFLACESSEWLSFRYSAHFTALLYAMKALYVENPSAWEKCVNSMSPALYERFVSANGLMSFPTGIIRKAQLMVTDAFLRFSGDVSGTASYERFIWLIADHWGLVGSEEAC